MSGEQDAPAERPRGIRFAPTLEGEDTPPPVATEVAVHGGADMLTLEFFHVGPTRIRRALEGRADPPALTIEDGIAVVRSEPVARVALRFMVAADLLVRLIETALDSAPDLQEAALDLARRVEDAGRRVQALAPAVPPGEHPR